MLMSSSLALTSLRQIDPDQIQVVQMILALLEGKKEGNKIELASHIVETSFSDWVICGTGVSLHVAVAAGRPQFFREDRLSEMVDALDMAEPLLSEIEARTGLTLDPTEVVSIIPEDSIIIEVSSVDNSHVAYLALSPNFTPPIAVKFMFESLGTDWSKVPVAFEIYISGPSLNLEDAAAIDTGDLILIGGSAVGARLIWPAESNPTEKIVGRYDMFSGEFKVNGASITMEPGTEYVVDRNSSVTFSVPISIQMPNQMTNVFELSSMERGKTLNIGALTQGLPVSLLVADQEVAQGELVQLSDQFAVMIEYKISHSKAKAQLSEDAAGNN
jgi:Type III flagellar switch regulator (C-ring) FliN C-term